MYRDLAWRPIFGTGSNIKICSFSSEDLRSYIEKHAEKLTIWPESEVIQTRFHPPAENCAKHINIHTLTKRTPDVPANPLGWHEILILGLKDAIVRR
jgi:hypothetical protein